MRLERFVLLGPFPRSAGLVIAGLFFILASILPQPTQGTTSQQISPRLAEVLEDPGHPSRHTDGRVAVWVYFVGRGMTPSQRERALAEAEAALPDDVARRRSKVVTSGKRLVNESDLPLNPHD